MPSLTLLHINLLFLEAQKPDTASTTSIPVQLLRSSSCCIIMKTEIKWTDCWKQASLSFCVPFRDTWAPLPWEVLLYFQASVKDFTLWLSSSSAWIKHQPSQTLLILYLIFQYIGMFLKFLLITKDDILPLPAHITGSWIIRVQQNRGKTHYSLLPNQWHTVSIKSELSMSFVFTLLTTVYSCAYLRFTPNSWNYIKNCLPVKQSSQDWGHNGSSLLFLCFSDISKGFESNFRLIFKF